MSYDLSDIPFEEWQGFQIKSNKIHVADFSKTSANIDFGIVDYFGNGSFKGCNVRNLNKIKGQLNPNDFDKQTIQNNSFLFLTDIFDNEFKEKYYRGTLTIDDLINLSLQQLEELKQKDFQIDSSYDRYRDLMLRVFGIDRALQFYNYSKQEYEAVSEILKILVNVIHVSIESDIINTKITSLKDTFFHYAKQQILDSDIPMRPTNFPKLFVRENANIFLTNVSLPYNKKERYYNRKLKVQDLIDYPEVFKNISVDYVMNRNNQICHFIREHYGVGKFQQLVKKYPDVFLHLEQENTFFKFYNCFKPSQELETSFIQAVKEYFLNYAIPENFKIVKKGEISYNVPRWLSSMKFIFVSNLDTINDLMRYSNLVVLLNEHQRRVIDLFNIENIKRFELETGFFSHKYHENAYTLEIFNKFSSYFCAHSPSELSQFGIDFKNGTLSYEEFLNQLALCLDVMRRHDVFKDFPNYDWIQGEFRNNHPEIFMDLNAPEELKRAFYENTLNPEFLHEHKEYIPYLISKNLSNTINSDIKLSIFRFNIKGCAMVSTSVSFIDEYVSRYGNEKFLQLISRYGGDLSNIEIVSFHNEIDNEKEIEQSLRNAIYHKIIKENMNYLSLAHIPEFVSEHPELFVDFDSLINIPQEERARLTIDFYNQNLSFDDIKKYPELVNILKDKNLQVAFYKQHGNRDGEQHNDLELLIVFGNENFLKLCSKYGRYMAGIAGYLDFENIISLEEVSKKIEEIIISKIMLGNLVYRPEDAPRFLRENYPELFLSEYAPKELKEYFYSYSDEFLLSFRKLQEHKDWLPFLKDKVIIPALLRNKILRQDMIQFFQVFGEEKAIKLGINRAETVEEMMKAHKVDLMKHWYDKIGHKFIPDVVIMQNFSLEEADKFLLSGANWSKLMKIQNFAHSLQSRDAMLKLAYSFGAFDFDQRGFKKAQELLTGIPKKIDAKQEYILKRIDQQINLCSGSKLLFHKASRFKTQEEKEKAYQKMLNYIKRTDIEASLKSRNILLHPIDVLNILHVEGSFMNTNTIFHSMDILNNSFMNTNTLVNLLEAIKKENVDVDFTHDIFRQLYKKNEDGSFILTINQQSYPKTTQVVRSILEKFKELPILTPEKAYQLFGGFELKYDADFREFFLLNMDKIMQNQYYMSLVASIQRQFANIKAINSNRSLTLELAVSYVQINKFVSVNVGNERVAEISAIAGYSQEDFNILQQIYNYGKQRTFSSIPRIENTSGKYTYEMLRLDDPLAIAIGTLTDCCQELNNYGEVCMEHSMVDKNGRVFIIKDEQGNIVAQSWVWRNTYVLCFDNIEIPDKAFERAVKQKPKSGRNGFVDEIYEVYKQAAHELIEVDEKVYKELLESGKINQEQYDGLRLGKITVGLGHNDIAEALKRNSIVDKGPVLRTLPFEEPVRLSEVLYIKDSITQYILEEREGRKKFNGETLPVHNDTYVEYSDFNFTEKLLLSLQILEIVTKEKPENLKISVNDYIDSEHLVTDIARNYGLNSETARIIMNPNFAMIYDINGNKLKIADLLFNIWVDNGQQQMDIENQVVMQIRLGLEQIASGKEIDILSLNEKQRRMYNKVIGLTDEMDRERGVGHARQYKYCNFKCFNGK